MSAYGIRVYADTLGCWHAYVTFPEGASRNAAGTRLIRVAVEAAKRTIRAEVVAHMAPEPVPRLAYRVTQCIANPDTRRLASLTLSEDWKEPDLRQTQPLTTPTQQNRAGAFR